MFQSLHAYRKSWVFLQENGLSHVLWFPLIIAGLVIWGGFEAASVATDFLFETFQGWLKPESWLSEDLHVLIDVFYWVLWIILRILLYFVFAFIGGSVILLCMSPVLTWLSEKVAQRLGAKPVRFSLAQFVNDLLRAAGLALKNGTLQALCSLACLLIGFIPIVGFASPVILFAVNAYFYGYNLMDYSLERYGMSIRESQRFVWKKKRKTLSIGAPFALWMLVPLIGPVTAGFVAVFGTVAATMVLENERVKEVGQSA